MAQKRKPGTAKQPRRTAKQKRSTLLVRVALLCVAFYGVASFVQLQTQIAEKEARAAELKVQIDEDKAENDALRKKVEEGISDEEIAAMARDQYNYVLPNERVFVDSSGN